MLIEERGNTNVLSLKFADKIGYLSAACESEVSQHVKHGSCKQVIWPSN